MKKCHKIPDNIPNLIKRTIDPQIVLMKFKTNTMKTIVRHQKVIKEEEIEELAQMSYHKLYTQNTMDQKFLSVEKKDS